MANHPRQAHRRDGDEPAKRHRAEDGTNSACAALLHPKERDENPACQGRHHRREGVCGDFQPLHRRQHRDGWRDHAVTVEQRRAEKAQHDERNPRPLDLLPTALGLLVLGTFGLDLSLAHPGSECHQGQNAALAVVVGTHHVEDVLDRNDQGDGPKEQRKQPVDVRCQRRHAMRGGDALLERIEGRGADIAVNNAQRPQRKLGQIRAFLAP